jgi:hypothetical protein
MRTSANRSVWIDRPRVDHEVPDTPQLTATPTREHYPGRTLAIQSCEVSRCSFEPRHCFSYAVDS